MTKLSPAAQAVFEAAWTAFWPKNAEQPADAELIAAAALRAVADTKATEVSVEGHYRLIVDVDDILAIADELKSQ